jgi:hypothetical protein
MICDFSLVKEMEGALENFTALRDTEVLLLSGTASRPFLIHSCEELELYQVRHIHGCKA